MNANANDTEETRKSNKNANANDTEEIMLLTLILRRRPRKKNYSATRSKPRFSVQDIFT